MKTFKDFKKKWDNKIPRKGSKKFKEYTKDASLITKIVQKEVDFSSGRFDAFGIEKVLDY